MFNEVLDISKSKGYLKLKITNKRTGESFEEGHNLILDSAEEITADAISGGDGVTHFFVGNSETEITDKTMTSLAGTFTTFPLESKSSVGKVATFVFNLTTEQWNGNNIWQFALGNTSGTLFSAISRVTQGFSYPIEKTTEISVEGTWTITVEV